jgi:hypothetical protein
MGQWRSVVRVPEDVIGRLQKYADETGLSLNTLIVRGIRLMIGDKVYQYRIEQIHVPAYQGIQSENKGRECPRRIIHVLGEVRNSLSSGRDGRVLEVLTEEEI